MIQHVRIIINDTLAIIWECFQLAWYRICERGFICDDRQSDMHRVWVNKRVCVHHHVARIYSSKWYPFTKLTLPSVMHTSWECKYATFVRYIRHKLIGHRMSLQKISIRERISQHSLCLSLSVFLCGLIWFGWLQLDSLTLFLLIDSDQMVFETMHNLRNARIFRSILQLYALLAHTYANTFPCTAYAQSHALAH